MSPAKRRTHFLAVRLTDEEYASLKAACAQSGTRNLTEFTRTNLLNLARQADQPDRLTRLEAKLSDLQESIQSLLHQQVFD